MTTASSDSVALTDPALSWRARWRMAWTHRLRESGLERIDIRWRFRLVVLALGIPFLAFVVWSAAQQALVEKQAVRERSRADATLVAARFEDHIEQIDRLLATVAHSVGPRIGDAHVTGDLLQAMRSYVPKSIDNISLWGLDGNPIASLDPRSLTRAVNVADRAYFIDAIAHRDLAFQGPFRSRSTGTDVLMFARPVYDDKSNIVAVLTMAIRLDQLIEQCVPGGAISEESMITIVNDQGAVLSRSAETDLWIGKQQASRDALQAVFARHRGTQESIDPDGITRLSGYAVVGKWPWVVFVGEPIDRVLGPVSDRLMRNLGVGLAIFGLALLVARAVATWTIAPLRQLARDAERLGEGDLGHRSLVSTGGEIAALAANFNRMAKAVEDRESALTESRQQVQEFVSHFPGQVTLLDREERYLFINRVVERLSIVPPEEMLGRTMREVRGEEAYRIMEPALKNALQGTAGRAELTFVHDGETLHISVDFVPLRDASGAVTGAYVFTQEVTEQKTAELLLAENRKLLLTITDNVPAMICYLDEQRRFRFANSAFEEWFKRPLGDIIGQPMDRMMSPQVAAQYDYYFLRCLQGETVEYDVEVPSKKHGPRWLKCSFIPDIDEATGTTRGVYGLIHNVTKAKLAEQHLTRLAQFDTLTGLANRNQFNETLTRVLGQNDRDGKPLALMFLDIDHFKQINDRHGHGSGDLLLKDFAQRLADCVRPTDAVARLSGDEFVVLLEGMHSDDEPQFIARKIIAAVEKPFLLDGQFVRVTTSIGIAMRLQHGEAASELMKRADEALYEAKRSGRNTFRLAS
jgi:diguanylate cyclase (GGDEF)-like protein/PAS domain S-box-containing protein